MFMTKVARYKRRLYCMVAIKEKFCKEGDESLLCERQLFTGTEPTLIGRERRLQQARGEKPYKLGTRAVAFVGAHFRVSLAG